MTAEEMMADNTLSPHGGHLIERIAPWSASDLSRSGIKTLPVREQVVRECINVAYGFFSPLEGFMSQEDVESVVERMTLANGYVWSIPIIFDISQQEIDELSIAEGDTLLLTHQDQPLAILETEQIFTYDLEHMARRVYGTIDEAHPGVARSFCLKDRFLGGKVTLVNEPQINPPFDRFWYPPSELRQLLSNMGWSRVVAHQTRNVPHVGHEGFMKGAWFAAGADGVLVSAVVGEKRIGDYIDEAIVLAHDILRTAGYFRNEVHATSMLMWDMRYAGPKEAVFHAIVRKNLGCTHHMFGRDHAGVGSYYDPRASHLIFQEIPAIGIEPITSGEWWHCPTCEGIAYEGLCGHKDRKQDLSGTLMRQSLEREITPSFLTFRPEVFDVVTECTRKYGMGSPFVSQEYLGKREPVITMLPPKDAQTQ